MELTGENFIGSKRSKGSNGSFKAFHPVTNSELPETFHYATSQQINEAVTLAQQAFEPYCQESLQRRVAFLISIADEIVSLGDALVQRCVTETGLPIARIENERERTCNQLRLFAQLLQDGWYVDARIDTALHDRKPLPRSDIRRLLIPIGPIAVFGASNFPLAFSTAGGDTASALAAGCPVILKAHPSHPGTNEMVASAIVKAAMKTNMPEGVFSSLHLRNDDAVQLVQHPAIKAVGFTGSRNAGMKLFAAAAQRPDPIPVYAEMSSVNPVVVLPNALRKNASLIAKELVNSVTLGAGQFCTNPGLVIMIDDETALSFLELFASFLSDVQPSVMLNRHILASYQIAIDKLKNETHVALIAEKKPLQYESDTIGFPAAFRVAADVFLSNIRLSEEIFGPSTLFVMAKDEAQLKQVLQSLEGQLTFTLHAGDAESETVQSIMEIAVQKAGRIIFGAYPTGVEVCQAMQHGGPFPSTTYPFATSVGTAAINRFLRPVAFQNFPNKLLPQALQNNNPLNILRLVNGTWTKEPLL